MVISVIIFILTLLILVVIHELGHFLMAKKFGIKVEEFGFGIPPRIFGKKIGETLYSLNALPFGGFVRLLGEDEVSRPINGRDFRAKSVGQRIIVVVAGITMNLILAWILFYTVLIFQNFRIIYPALEPAAFVARVEENFPAQKMGIQVGDRVLAVEGTKVSSFDEVKKLIQDKNGAEVALKVANIDGADQKIIKITPKKTEQGYLIGVVFTPIPFKQFKTPAEKIFSGITYSFDLTRATFLGLGKTIHDVLSGNFKAASQSVAGPVGMASISNNILSAGRQASLTYLWFMGVISLTLTIFNVLPIPALDGGRLLFLVIEAITRKKVREDIERKVHQIGFAILLTLALLVTYSDIIKIIH